MAADMYSDALPFNAAFDWFAQWLRGRADADLMLGAHHPPTAVKSILERQAAFRSRTQ